MTFRSLMLSVLLTLSLIGSPSAGPICGRMGKRLVCYNTSREQLVSLIRRKAKELGIDPKLAVKLAQAESGLNPLAYSPKGAIGVMQLLPQTAEELGVDPWDIEQNIEGGLRYLKMLLKRYGDEKLALAAYNAGPGAVERHRGVPPYSETRRFIAKVKGGLTGSRKSSIRVIRMPDGTILITNLPPELVR